MNISVIGGRLVATPVLRHNNDGQAVSEFTVALNEGERTDYVDCVAWGKTAEFLCNHFEKGKLIYVEGKIRTNVWEKRDGVKAKDVKLSVKEIHFG